MSSDWPHQAFRRLLLLTLLCAVGCRSMAPSDFASNSPSFQPLEFFDGQTRSWAVIENRSGNPTSQFTADLVGRRDGERLSLEQAFTFRDGRKEHRSWKITRIDKHHYEATANDVIGISRGEARGNAFRWSYTTEGRRSWPLDDLHFDLWMYLTDDGTTLINRVNISKFGVVVARTTEYFQRR